MGGILSLDNPKRKEGERCKTRKISSGTFEEDTRLIPCLPDGIALQILARIPRIHYLNIKRVSRSWKNGITGSELYRLRKELAASEEWLYILTKVDGDKLLWYCFDPLSTKWQRLPLMPMVSHGDKGRKKGLGSTIRMLNAIGSSIWIAHVIRGWLGRKDTMDRMPYTGCSVGALDGSLYVLSGFAQALALTSVWRYDQTLNKWSEVSPMSAGRAHCKAVALDGRLYVVGGVGGGLNPLQSAEAYDPYTGSWIQLPSIPFSKAKVLAAAFLADLKPFASGLISYRGRLFIAQSLYSWPLFVYVGGEVYDPQARSWDEMPLGDGRGLACEEGRD
ncbi:hypothetical protein SAY86_006742 [Trapa natans]|uniref:F-box domain-containing protein n=1 Tax=Trapa natans TaxID=22666 RepID=A0AAN7L767_TRANT|nr:hypothetical protein SAY86_006742 [Trapa natans]